MIDESPTSAPSQVVIDGYTITAFPYATIYSQNSLNDRPPCPSSIYGLAFKATPKMEASKLQSLINHISVFRGLDASAPLPATQNIVVTSIAGQDILGINYLGGNTCGETGPGLMVGDTIWMLIQFNSANASVKLKSDTAKVIAIS